MVLELGKSSVLCKSHDKRSFIAKRDVNSACPLSCMAEHSGQFQGSGRTRKRPSHARVFESRGPGLRTGCYGHETSVAVTNVHVQSQHSKSRTEYAHGYCIGLRPECVSCGTVTHPINSG